MSWVQFPGKARTDKYPKSVLIKTFAKFIHFLTISKCYTHFYYSYAVFNDTSSLNTEFTQPQAAQLQKSPLKQELSKEITTSKPPLNGRLGKSYRTQSGSSNKSRHNQLRRRANQRECNCRHRHPSLYHINTAQHEMKEAPAFPINLYYLHGAFNKQHLKDFRVKQL